MQSTIVWCFHTDDLSLNRDLRSETPVRSNLSLESVSGLNSLLIRNDFKIRIFTAHQLFLRRRFFQSTKTPNLRRHNLRFNTFNNSLN